MTKGPFGLPRPFAEQKSTAVLKIKTTRGEEEDVVSDVLLTIDNEMSEELAGALADRIETAFGRYLSSAEYPSEDGVDVLLPVEGMSPEQVAHIQNKVEQNMPSVEGASIESVEVD